ncbi:hypothetical protein D3C80_1882650 [compost metagenome]
MDASATPWSVKPCCRSAPKITAIPAIAKAAPTVAFAVIGSLRIMRPSTIEEMEALAISITTTPAAA